MCDNSYRHCAAIHRKKMNLLLFVIFALTTISAEPPKCGLYGAPPCIYIPAPPGITPSCAGPGKTYCESAPHYPQKVINRLISKYGYEISKLLVDETFEEFNTVIRFKDSQPDYFGPIHNHNTYQPPTNNVNYNNNEGYQYPRPKGGPNGYHYSPPNQLYSHSGSSGNSFNEDPIYIPRPRQQQGYNNKPYQQNRNPNKNYYFESQGITEFNSAESFRRYTRDISRKNSLPTSDRLEETQASVTDSRPSKNLFYGLNIDTDVKQTDEDYNSNNRTRTKRQSLGRSSLCAVNTQYIMPQAALNNRGNWMYVINQDETSRQLVKTETCASSVCSNLCQLPNGYNSRCEQKFIQKRLIALNGNGQNFYTDTFWFPSCCVCTISNQ